MAIDYGGKRCGVAVTDPLQIIASGLDTLPTPKLFKFVLEYHKQEKLDALVLGIPYRMDGSLSTIAKDIEKFMDRIHAALPELPLHGIDETLTSQKAVESMVISGVPKKKRRNKELIDKVSATLILQKFLEEYHS